MMTAEELSRSAAFIARVKVLRAEKVNFRGTYSQVATLQPVDVIEGDFTLKQVFVFAKTNVRCADDQYLVGDEMLVFLVPKDGLFHTLNFQHGQFPIVGDVVKAWRDKQNRPVDKPYAQVREEIDRFIHAPPTQPIEGLPPGAQPEPPQAKKPPEPALSKPKQPQ